MTRLRLLGLMARPRAAITMWTFLVIGLARHAGSTISVDLVAATIALAASYIVATSANDIADVAIDRANGLRDASRPLATGAATVADLRWTAGIGAGVAMLAAIPLGTTGLAVIALCLAVDVAYSATPARLSRRWTLAPVALTVAYVALPYGLGIVVAHDRWRSFDAALLAGLCILFFARIILKDVRDRLGDAAHGKPTMLLRLGKNATCAVSIVAAVVRHRHDRRGDPAAGADRRRDGGRRGRDRMDALAAAPDRRIRPASWSRSARRLARATRC